MLRKWGPRLCETACVLRNLLVQQLCGTVTESEASAVAEHLSNKTVHPAMTAQLHLPPLDLSWSLATATLNLANSTPPASWRQYRPASDGQIQQRQKVFLLLNRTQFQTECHSKNALVCSARFLPPQKLSETQKLSQVTPPPDSTENSDVMIG